MIQSQKSSPIDPYNLLTAEANANPYPIYQRLRSEDPLHWSNTLLGGAWILTRYADVKVALNEPRLADVYPDMFSTLDLELPSHQKFRTLVHKAFKPKMVEGMRHHVETVVDKLLDAVQDAGRMEIMSDFAHLLPLSVIFEMSGISSQNSYNLKEWAEDLSLFLGAVCTTPQLIERCQTSTADLAEYLHQIIQQRRQNPQEDLITNLVTVEEEGEVFTEAEIIGTYISLLYASYTSTINLIGNGLLALLQHPDQMRKLRDHPELIGSAVEELLRYESPFQWVSRQVKEDFEFQGKQFQKKQRVAVMVGAANRDPEVFPDADKLILERQKNPHLAFGYGSQFCLGERLARMEGQIAINKILRRLPGLQLETESPQRLERVALRKLKSLPVVFSIR